jgi:hypothetical protein
MHFFALYVYVQEVTGQRLHCDCCRRSRALTLDLVSRTSTIYLIFIINALNLHYLCIFCIVCVCARSHRAEAAL